MKRLLLSACLVPLFAPFVMCPSAAAASSTGQQAEVFELELRRIQGKLEQGQWALAERHLQSILASHARQSYVVKHLGEIDLILQRCLFWKDHEGVDVSALLRGRLVRQDRKRGTLEIEYNSPGQSDFKLRSSGQLSLHSVDFSGPYSIELQGDDRALVGVCIRPEFMISVQFGVDTPPPASGNKPDKSRTIERWVEITTFKVNSSGETVPKASRRNFTTRGDAAQPTLLVEVNESQVKARFDGRTQHTVRKPAGTFGGLGLLESSPHGDQITIKGDASAWIKLQRDTQAAGPLSAFERSWRLEQHVPAWLMEAASDPTPAVNERPSLARRAPTSLIQEAQRNSANKLLSGQAQACLELISEYIDKGVPAGELQQISSTANKALHGPSWTRKYSYDTAHYSVSSDVSREVSRQVALSLEQALKHIPSRLGLSSSTFKDRFIVYVFSGEQAYGRFVRDLFGSRIEHSTGMYSAALKQLLILHTRDQAESLDTARHEGFHQILDAVVPNPPLWLNEGLAEYFAASGSREGQWVDGTIQRGRLFELQNLAQAPGGLSANLIPLEKFLHISPEAFMGSAAHNYAQAWAFVHFMRHSSVSHRDSFTRLLSEVLKGRSGAQAVADAFPQPDWPRLDMEFRRHIESL